MNILVQTVKYRLIQLFAFIVLCTLNIEKSNGQEYYSYFRYRDGLTLSWSDFEGEIDFESKGTAACAVAINYEILKSEKHVVIDVGAYFSPTESWVRVRSDEGLIHESYHFKLAEIPRRMMLEELYRIDIDLDYIEELMADRMRNFGSFHDGQQEKYDRETSHGVYADKQTEYEEYIDEWLSDLHDYRFKYLVLKLSDDGKTIESRELIDELPNGVKSIK